MAPWRRRSGSRFRSARVLRRDPARQCTGARLMKCLAPLRARFPALEVIPRLGAGPGWCIQIPAEPTHGFRVESNTARYVIITTRHHVDFFLAVSETAERNELPPAEEPDYARIDAACAQFGVAFPGEWPEEEPPRALMTTGRRSGIDVGLDRVYRVLHLILGVFGAVFHLVDSVFAF